MLAALLGALLLHIAQRVQDKQDDLFAIQATIAEEDNTIRVLNAEWAYLNAPERLERMAMEHYGVKSPTALQMIDGAGNDALPFPTTIENIETAAGASMYDLQDGLHTASFQTGVGAP